MKLPKAVCIFFNFQLIAVCSFGLHSGINTNRRAFPRNHVQKAQHQPSLFGNGPPLLLDKFERNTQLGLFKWPWRILFRDCGSKDDDEEEKEKENSPIKYIQSPSVPLGTAYSSARGEVVIRQVMTDLSIPIYEGEHIWESPVTTIGDLRFFADPKLLAAVRFTYNYNSEADTLTITGEDFVDNQASTTLITWPQGSDQYGYQPTFVSSDTCPCNSNPNWDYTTALTPGLANSFTENIRAIHRLIFNQAVVEFDVVQVRTPLSRAVAEAEDYHLNWIGMYSEDNTFLGTYDPENEYPPGTTMHHLVKSTFGGKVHFEMNENFANVIGSTPDPKVESLSWIQLWKDNFGVTDPTCTSLNWASGAHFACTTNPNIYGGHVIKGTLAAKEPLGSNDVYIMPICPAHNNNDSVYMRADKYTSGIWLKNYLAPLMSQTIENRE